MEFFLKSQSIEETLLSIKKVLIELPKTLKSAGDNASIDILMKILSFSTRVHLEFLKIGKDGGKMELIRNVLTRILHSEERDPQRINNLMKKLVDKFERLQSPVKSFFQI
jgi:hypothetical protein